MKSKRKYFVMAVLLVFLLAGAAIGYHSLSAEYEPENVTFADDRGISSDEETSAETPERSYASDFRMLDSEGNEVRLVDFVGTPILLNFWASWCPPCKSELPAFEEAYQNHGDAIQFLMVDLADGVQETMQSGAAYIADNDYTFPVFYDISGASISAYQIYSIPVTVVIDSNGYVVRSQIGAMSEEGLAAMVDMLLD